MPFPTLLLKGMHDAVNEKSNPIDDLFAEHFESSRKISNLTHSILYGDALSPDDASGAPEDFWKKMATVTDEQLRGALEKLNYDSATINGMDRNAMVDAVLKAYNKKSGNRENDNPFVTTSTNVNGFDSVDGLSNQKKLKLMLKGLDGNDDALRNMAKNLGIERYAKKPHQQLLDEVKEKLEESLAEGNLSFEESDSADGKAKNVTMKTENGKAMSMDEFRAYAKKLGIDSKKAENLPVDELVKLVNDKLQEDVDVEISKIK